MVKMTMKVNNYTLFPNENELCYISNRRSQFNLKAHQIQLVYLNENDSTPVSGSTMKEVWYKYPKTHRVIRGVKSDMLFVDQIQSYVPSYPNHAIIFKNGLVYKPSKNTSKWAEMKQELKQHDIPVHKK